MFYECGLPGHSKEWFAGFVAAIDRTISKADNEQDRRDLNRLKKYFQSKT